MRVGIIALLQESNTFISGTTTFAHFEQDLLLEGERTTERFALAIGADHLSQDEQRPAVKRVKDRIKKRIERKGGSNDTSFG